MNRKLKIVGAFLYFLYREYIYKIIGVTTVGIGYFFGTARPENNTGGAVLLALGLIICAMGKREWVEE